MVISIRYPNHRHGCDFLVFSLYELLMSLRSFFLGFQLVALNITSRLTHLSILLHQVSVLICSTTIPVAVNSDLLEESVNMISIIANHLPVYTVKYYVSLLFIEGCWLRSHLGY